MMKVVPSLLVIFTWSVVKEVTARSLIKTIQHPDKARYDTDAPSNQLAPGDVLAISTQKSSLSQADSLFQRIVTKKLQGLNDQNELLRRARRGVNSDGSQNRFKRTVPATTNMEGLVSVFDHERVNAILNNLGGPDRPNVTSRHFGNDPVNCPSRWTWCPVAEELGPNIYPRFVVAPNLVSVTCRNDPSSGCQMITRPIVVLRRAAGQDDVEPFVRQIPVGFACQTSSLQP